MTTPVPTHPITESPIRRNLIRRVLHVEDNPNDARLLVEAVTESRLDLVIDLVANGVRAIEFLHESADPAVRAAPDLILLDLNLPVMDGMTLLRVLSKNEVWRRVPVIVLSGSHRRDEQEQALHLGALSYVVKPRVYSGYLELAWRLPYYPRAVPVSGTPHAASVPVRDCPV